VKRTKKSVKKLRTLIMLIMVMAVLLIASTYAWFSTQRDVEITGMRLNVEVAESMQISLDGETWLQSIEIDNMRQFYGTYGESGKHQANEAENTNYVPTELLPVSSDGTVTNGKLQFVQGTIIGKSLIDISKCSEAQITAGSTVEFRENGETAVETDGNKAHPYLVFDMFLRNVSASETTDTLKLNKESRLWADTTIGAGTEEGVSTADTGLEYSARVGFVLYDNTIAITEGDTPGGQTIGQKVRALTTGASGKVAIWEPNHLEHTQYVVNNDARITALSQDFDTLPIKNTVTADIDDVTDEEDTTNLAVDSDGDATVVTMKPTYSLTGDATATPPVAPGTTEAVDITYTDGTSTLELKANQISRVRVYIWLEGQDPDCIDLASTGGKIDINIKLTKDENEKDEVTYAGAGGGAGGAGGAGGENPNKLTAADLTAEDYGGTITNYTPTNGATVGWKIFHADATNNTIYLIADDYVDRTYVPAGRNEKAIKANSSYSRGFGMNDIVDDTSASKYLGWEDLSSTEIASRWLKQYKEAGFTSTNENMKATAYLLDTNQWSGFKDSTYASYAIGGPTIEMFAESYKVTHPTQYIETAAEKAIFEDTETGYNIKWHEGTYFSSGIYGLDAYNSLYNIESSEDDGIACGMWVASPSAHPYEGMIATECGRLRGLQRHRL